MVAKVQVRFASHCHGINYLLVGTLPQSAGRELAFGEGLILGGGPSPLNVDSTAVRAVFRGEGVGAEIRPSP